MTLKLCRILCLNLRMNLWNLNNQMLWWDTYPSSLNLSLVFQCLNRLFMMQIFPLVEECNIFRILWLEELSLQLNDMVTVEILTVKHWRNWNLDLIHPLLLWKLHWTDSGKRLVYKITNLKKLGTCLILCRPLCGPFRSLVMKVSWKRKLTFPSLLTSCLKSSKSNGKITPKLPIWKGLFLLNLVCGERINQIFMMIAIQRCQASSYLNLPKKKLGTVGLMQWLRCHQSL